MTRRVGVLTSGGDAPGMNAAIRAVVRTANRDDVEVVGFHGGFAGLLDDAGRVLGPRDVANVIQRGGSILDVGRDERFREPDGRTVAIRTLGRAGCEALIVIGGGGTMRGARALESEWPAGHVVGIPSSIDNDLGGTDRSIGFDTACNTALEAIDRIRDTAHALDRLFFVEVMGRDRGFIAVDVGVGGGAEMVLCPEEDLDAGRVFELVRRNVQRGKASCIVVVAEGAHPGGARGLLQEMEESLEGLAGLAAPSRVTILGHIQRGGNPTVADRVLASRLGVAATRAVLAGESGVLFGLRGAEVTATPFETALSDPKRIDREVMRIVDLLA